jgi:hypothetical protein
MINNRLVINYYLFAIVTVRFIAHYCYLVIFRIFYKATIININNNNDYNVHICIN